MFELLKWAVMGILQGSEVFVDLSCSFEVLVPNLYKYQGSTVIPNRSSYTISLLNSGYSLGHVQYTSQVWSPEDLTKWHF